MNNKNRFKGHYTFSVDGMYSERKFSSSQENTAYSGPIQLTQIKVGKFQTKPLESHFLKTQSQVQRKVQIIKYAKMLEKLHCM